LLLTFVLGFSQNYPEAKKVSFGFLIFGLEKMDLPETN